MNSIVACDLLRQLVAIPSVNPALSGDDAERMQKLLDVIEDLDDVQDVFHNAEMADPA